MKRETLTITPEDIQQADQLRRERLTRLGSHVLLTNGVTSSNCPLACALARQYPDAGEPSVTPAHLWLGRTGKDRHLATATPSQRMVAFMRRWERQCEARPTAFLVKWERT